MFNPLKLFDSTAREIKRLNKDAPNIVEYARQCFRVETVRAIADTTRQHLERAHAHYPGNREGWKQAVIDYEVPGLADVVEVEAVRALEVFTERGDAEAEASKKFDENLEFLWRCRSGRPCAPIAGENSR